MQTAWTPDSLFAMFDLSQVLVAAYDGGDRLRYANPAFRAAFFVPPGSEPLWGDLMRRNHQYQRGTVIRDPDFDTWLLSTQSRRGKVGFRAFETDLSDGRWLWMTETVRADGWMLCVASDITTLRADDRAVRQDRDLAIRTSFTDDLTGIANRRYILERINDMLRASGPDGVPVGCVAMLDIDHFKDINDRFGHQQGDLILRDFAQRIHPQVGRLNSFGRVGGEEFVLVLPGVPVAAAVDLIGGMLLEVRASRPIAAAPGFSYTFSGGIAAGCAGEDALFLLERADQALYAAKMGGRDRVRVASLGDGTVRG